MTPTAIPFPPSVAPLVQELLNYLMWLGITAFVVGLIWAFTGLFVASIDDAPGAGAQRGKYIGIILVAGILMASAGGIGHALVDTNPSAPITQGSTSSGKF